MPQTVRSRDACTLLAARPYGVRRYAALAAGEIHDHVTADIFLDAVATLCMSVDGAQPGQAEQLVTLLVDGLRYRPGPPEPDQPRPA